MGQPDRKRVRRVGGWGFRQAKKSPHHKGDLIFSGRTRAHSRLLDPVGRVFKNG